MTVRLVQVHGSAADSIILLKSHPPVALLQSEGVRRPRFVSSEGIRIGVRAFPETTVALTTLIERGILVVLQKSLPSTFESQIPVDQTTAAELPPDSVLPLVFAFEALHVLSEEMAESLSELELTSDFVWDGREEQKDHDNVRLLKLVGICTLNIPHLDEFLSLTDVGSKVRETLTVFWVT